MDGVDLFADEWVAAVLDTEMACGRSGEPIDLEVELLRVWGGKYTRRQAGLWARRAAQGGAQAAQQSGRVQCGAQNAQAVPGATQQGDDQADGWDGGSTENGGDG